MSLDESYRVLELKPGATFQEARRSYYRLLKFFHPDRHQASAGLLQKATEETKKLNLAYERIRKVLGTAPEKRKRDKTPGSPPKQGQPFMVPSCGIKLNWIAGGRFRMGSPGAEAGRSNDEGPQTDVTISRGFWLAIFPVTQEQWRSVAQDVTGLKGEPSYFRGDQLPVEQVSWDDCQRWLKELNDIEEDANRLPQNFLYRLPTEAEWEFACRAGSSARFYFGDTDGQLDDYAWHSSNSHSQTQPVGQKKPNLWGLHDMHGNVWEWCHDRYGGSLPGGGVTDPVGPVLGANRVLRGGSWGVNASRCRAAYRVWNKPGYRDYTLGFRLALAAGD